MTTLEFRFSLSVLSSDVLDSLLEAVSDLGPDFYSAILDLLMVESMARQNPGEFPARRSDRIMLKIDHDDVAFRKNAIGRLAAGAHKFEEQALRTPGRAAELREGARFLSVIGEALQSRPVVH